MLNSPRRHLEAVIRNKEGQQLARCLLRRGRYVIGQDRRNEITVDEPSVSSKHARLTVVSDEEFLIEDLDSANGTLVNGQPAQGATPVSLESKVQLGHTTLAFQRGGLPAAVFAALPPAFLRGQRYNFGEAVVHGSTSMIFEAHDTSLGRDVAIKLMRPECQANPAHVLRFVREAQITSQLQHPGILPIYELNLDGQSRLFYTTRFVEGESLGAILDRLSLSDPETLAQHGLAPLLAIFQKACDAVGFAHSRGAIHGALRPEGISVGRFGEVVVGNWGLSRVVETDASGESVPQPIRAALASAMPPLSVYSAPEQASDEGREISARSDIYALGGILYRVLTLRAPIIVQSDAELAEKLRTGAIQPLASLARQTFPHCPGGHLPEPLCAVATKALSLAPADRFGSVPALQAEIAAWQSGLGNGSDQGIWKQVSGLLGKNL